MYCLTLFSIWFISSFRAKIIQLIIHFLFLLDYITSSIITLFEPYSPFCLFECKKFLFFSRWCFHSPSVSICTNMGTSYSSRLCIITNNNPLEIPSLIYINKYGAFENSFCDNLRHLLCPFFLTILRRDVIRA